MSRSVHSDRPTYEMLWGRLAIRYGWTIVARELETSARWSPRTKAKAGALAGAAISLPVVLSTALPYMYWLLTGKGPWHRYGFSSAVVVDPFPRQPPAEIRVALTELSKARPGESCPVGSDPRPR
jgi:hypothetical protein